MPRTSRRVRRQHIAAAPSGSSPARPAPLDGVLNLYAHQPRRHGRRQRREFSARVGPVAPSGIAPRSAQIARSIGRNFLGGVFRGRPWNVSRRFAETTVFRTTRSHRMFTASPRHVESPARTSITGRARATGLASAGRPFRIVPRARCGCRVPWTALCLVSVGCVTAAPPASAQSVKFILLADEAFGSIAINPYGNRPALHGDYVACLADYAGQLSQGIFRVAAEGSGDVVVIADETTRIPNFSGLLPLSHGVLRRRGGLQRGRPHRFPGFFRLCCGVLRRMSLNTPPVGKLVWRQPSAISPCDGPPADFTADASVNSRDVFTYLDICFAGCSTGRRRRRRVHNHPIRPVLSVSRPGRFLSRALQ